MKANLEQARNELFYGLDGHASDRIVDVIENRLGLRS